MSTRQKFTFTYRIAIFLILFGLVVGLSGHGDGFWFNLGLLILAASATYAAYKALLSLFDPEEPC